MKFYWVRTFLANLDYWEPAVILPEGGLLLLGSETLYQTNDKGEYLYKDKPIEIGKEIVYGH